VLIYSSITGIKTQSVFSSAPLVVIVVIVVAYTKITSTLLCLLNCFVHVSHGAFSSCFDSPATSSNFFIKCISILLALLAPSDWLCSLGCDCECSALFPLLLLHSSTRNFFHLTNSFCALHTASDPVDRPPYISAPTCHFIHLPKLILFFFAPNFQLI